MNNPWNKAYNTLRAREQLGYYNFRGEPVVHPEYHAHFDDPGLNEVHLLATAEHERIHDMLARQTTHGFVLLLLNRRLKVADDEEAFELLDVADRVHAAGRDAHEMYALYGTLKSSRPYATLLETLPPEYQVWLTEAESYIPENLKGTRLGRLVVYVAVLYALSPRLPVFNGSQPVVTQLLAAGKIVANVGARLLAVKEHFSGGAAAGAVDVEELARAIGYGASELALPVFFEDTNLLIFRPGEESFEERETRLVWRLLEVLSERLPSYHTAVGGIDLRENVSPYCKAIAPKLRLRSTLVEAWGITDAEHGRLHQLLQENIHSGLFNFPVKYTRSLIRTTDAFNRVLEDMHNQGYPMLLGGYATNKLLDELAKKFRPYADFQSNRHIQWYFINAKLNAYPAGDTVYVVYTLDNLNHGSLVIPAGFPSAVMMAAYDYYDNPDLVELYQPLEQLGTPLYLLQAINLLDLVEWHLERGLACDQLKIELTRVPGELFSLSRVYFPETPHPFVRLIGPSTRIGMVDLATSGHLPVSLQEMDMFTGEDQVVVAFLRMLWRE